MIWLIEKLHILAVTHIGIAFCFTLKVALLNPIVQQTSQAFLNCILAGILSLQSCVQIFNRRRQTRHKSTRKCGDNGSEPILQIARPLPFILCPHVASGPLCFFARINLFPTFIYQLFRPVCCSF